jgi:hypothetical protein
MNSSIIQRNNVGALAASAVFDSVGIDFGPNFMPGIFLAMKNGTASAGESLRIDYSDDNTTWTQAPGWTTDSGAAFNSSSGGGMYLKAPVFARFMRAHFVNGATAQTALNINITAVPIL